MQRFNLAGKVGIVTGGNGGIGKGIARGLLECGHLYSAKARLGPLSVSKDEANAANLDRWLLDRCTMEGVDGFPTRTLLQSGPNATRKREDFNRAVELLAGHGRVRLVHVGNRRRLVVNPALLDGVAAIGSADHLPDEC